MKLRVVTPPSVEPVSAAEARAHMHLDSSDDDVYIGTLCTAAREAAESFTRRAFVSTVFDLAIDCVDGAGIELLRAPLVSVTSVTSYDEDSAASVMSSDEYYVDTFAEPGVVSLVSGASWPSSLRASNGIIVRYTAGYGANATDVPMQIRTAIKEAVKVWYDGGDDAGTSIDERLRLRLPQLATALLKPYRLVML